MIEKIKSDWQIRTMSKKSQESKNELLKQKAKDSNRVDHFNFLNHLINIQLYKYINSTQYKKPYMSTLERILRNMDK